MNVSFEFYWNVDLQNILEDFKFLIVCVPDREPSDLST
jgi:hypothetical protein